MLTNLVRRSLLLPRRPCLVPATILTSCQKLYSISLFANFQKSQLVSPKLSFTGRPLFLPISKAPFSADSGKFILSSSVLFFLEVAKKKLRSKQTIQELENYMERGRKNALNPSASLLQLEDIIKYYSDSSEYQKLLSTKEYCNPGEVDEFFIALAAPSLTGKTQMAFNIRSKRPLYFSVNYKQHINKNFKQLSRKLNQIVVDDQNQALEFLDSLRIYFAADDIRTISLELIDKNLLDFKFQCLGFLAHLVLDAEKNFDGLQAEDNWMRFYTRKEDEVYEYKFDPLSVNEILTRKDIWEPLNSKYFVFLDEFYSDIHNFEVNRPREEEIIRGLVLLRNLCRYMRIPCLIASTNSNVANIIGSSLRTGSRGEPPMIWCVVKPKYHHLSPEEVEGEFEKALNFKNMQIPINEEERFHKMIRFLKEQCAKSRAGMTYCVLNALKSAAEHFEFTDCDTFFINFMKNLINVVMERKLQAFTSKGGIDANVRLLSGSHFDPKYDTDASPGLSDSEMIDNHFAYLKTPIEDPKLMNHFLLFRSRVPFKNVKLCRTPISYDIFSVQCYFDEGEELLKLVCLFVAILSPTRLAFTNREVSGDINFIKNPEAKSTPGEALENYAFSSILDSSHYSDSERKLNFRGVMFENFLRNLLRNLSKANITRFEQKTKLEYNPKLDGFMKSVKVPCLYIANHDWNPEFRNIFNPKESSFRLGQYRKTPNKSEIDAVFDLIDGRDGKDDVNSLAVVECKNRAKSISSSDYKSILEKALKYAKLKHIETLLAKKNSIIPKELRNDLNEVLKPPKGREDDYKSKLKKLLNLDLLKKVCPTVHFLFCQSCSVLDQNILENVEGAEYLKINILKLVKKRHDQYELVNYKRGMHANPSMTAIIIDLDVIDTRGNEELF